MTTSHMIAGWFHEGVQKKASHLIVVCDTFDHEDYPVYVKDVKDFWETHEQYNFKNMQRIMEVYDLSVPWKDQQEARVFNPPPR